MKSENLAIIAAIFFVVILITIAVFTDSGLPQKTTQVETLQLSQEQIIEQLIQDTLSTERDSLIGLDFSLKDISVSSGEKGGLDIAIVLSHKKDCGESRKCHLEFGADIQKELYYQLFKGYSDLGSVSLQVENIRSQIITDKYANKSQQESSDIVSHTRVLGEEAKKINWSAPESEIKNVISNIWEEICTDIYSRNCIKLN